jgi:hypothetical protein
LSCSFDILEIMSRIIYRGKESKEPPHPVAFPDQLMLRSLRAVSDPR